MEDEKIFLGLDIGTDSIGYAVTNQGYQLKKYNGNPIWGVTLFEAANLNTERRSFRSARRRLEDSREFHFYRSCLPLKYRGLTKSSLSD